MVRIGLTSLKGILAIVLIWLGFTLAIFPALPLLGMLQQQAASLTGMVIPQLCPDSQCLQTNQYVVRVGDERDAVVQTLAADAWYSGTCAFDTAEIPLLHEVFLFGSRHQNWVTAIMVDSKWVNDTRVVHAFTTVSPQSFNFRMGCIQQANWASQASSPEVGLVGLGFLMMVLRPYVAWRANRSRSPAITRLFATALVLIGSILLGSGLLVLNMYLFFVILIGSIVFLVGGILLFILYRVPMLLVRKIKHNRLNY